MKRRRRTRRARLGSTAARFVDAATMAVRQPRAAGLPASAQEAIRLFGKVRSETSCPVALESFAEGQRQLGRLVEYIEEGGSGSLVRFKDALVKTADAARAAQRTLTVRCFCNR